MTSQASTSSIYMDPCIGKMDMGYTHAFTYRQPFNFVQTQLQPTPFMQQYQFNQEFQTNFKMNRTRCEQSLPPSHQGQPQQYATATDSCQEISQVLLCYLQGGDQEFTRKAIESLVKKLKDKPGELDSLITAVTSAGKQPTSCVTIQRSLDGRLQVAGKKGVPHVVYARIWRWPDVNKNELMKLNHCHTSPDHPDCICINPYHYERVVSNGISQMEMQSLSVETVQQTLDEMSNQPLLDESDFYDYQPYQQQPAEVHQMASYDYCNSQFDYRNYDFNQIPLLFHQAPSDWCSINYYEMDTQIGETFKGSHQFYSRVTVDGGMNPLGENHGRFCLGVLSNVHRTEASEKARVHIGDGIVIETLPNDTVTVTTRGCKIFVRSGFLDYHTRVQYGSKAHRYTPVDGPITVFDLRWAYVQMLRRRDSSNHAARAQAAAVAGYSTGGMAAPTVVPDSGVDRMRRDFCTIAISFVKGWGECYPRNTIKETPCWIEIQLHKPLQLLDLLLKQSSTS